MTASMFAKTEAFPTITREKKSSEYDGMVTEMIADREPRSASFDGSTAELLAAVDSVVYAVQSAGRQHGVSIRKAIEVNGKTVDKAANVTPEKGLTVKVTFIARDKITRARKTEAVAAAPSNEVAVAPKPGPARNTRKR